MKLKTSLFIAALLIFICCIGSASATDTFDDNSQLMEDTDEVKDTISEVNNEKTNTFETDDNAKDLQSLSYSGTEVNASNWNAIHNHAKRTDKNFIIKLTGTSYHPTKQITFGNNATIIGTANSYITAGSYTLIPFLNNNSALTINFINVTFKDMSVTYLLELAGTKTLENCNFYNITAGTGQNAVIYNTLGTMNLINCNIVDSSAGYGVVSNYNSGTVTGVVMNVNDCTFVRNSANVEPGAINNCGILNVDNSQFINNTAAWWAGAIHTHYNARTMINNSLFEGNVAGWNGGALYTYSTLKTYNTVFKKNKCHTNIGGGAIGASRWWAGNYNITIENCTFEENENCHADGNGGAITALNSGALNVHDSTFINNAAANGQAIAAFSQAFENITAGIPNLKVYNNTFYNHTLTSSDTVEISGNYTFENNTFNNCYQQNLGTNNIFINLVTPNNKNLSTILNQPLLKATAPDILKDWEEHDIIYINSSSENDPYSDDVDGQSWENAYGGIEDGFSIAAGNIKNNGIIYLADGYYETLFTDEKNITFIGQGVNTRVKLKTNYGTEIGEKFTFINLTVEGNDYQRPCHFINCTIAGSFSVCSGFNHYAPGLEHAEQDGCAFTRNIIFDNCTFIQNARVNVYMYGLVNFTNCTFKDITADSIVTKKGTFYVDDGIYFYNCKFSNCDVKGIVDIPGNIAIETYCEIEDCDYDFDATTDIETVGDYEHNYLNATKLKIVAVETSTSIKTENGNVIVTVKDAEGNPVSNVNVIYTVNGVGNNKTTDANGTIAVSNLKGNIEFKAFFEGNDALLPSNASSNFTFKYSTKLSASKVSATYNAAKNLVITLKDEKGIAISGKKINVKVGTINKAFTTDKNGQVKINVATLVPKTYTATFSFAGAGLYAASSNKASVVVSKATPKLTTQKLTTKVKVKTKMVKATLKDNKGKVLKNTKVTLKINGKTYKATTNKKGVATFKVTKLNKKGTFKGTVMFAGSKYFKAVNKKVTVVVKK